MTTSCQVSQANVVRLIIGFLPEGILLLFSYGSNLSRSTRSKITSGTAEFIGQWPVREPGKSRIKKFALQLFAVVSIVLCTKHLRRRSSISVSVTPNNSHSAVVWQLTAPVSLRGYNAAGLAENEHTPYVNYAKLITAIFQLWMAMLCISCTQTWERVSITETEDIVPNKRQCDGTCPQE